MGLLLLERIADVLLGVLLPTHYIPVHQSAIRAISWVRVPTISGSGEQTTDNPTVIATGGYDGMECVTDVREGMGNALNRTRGRLVRQGSLDY